MLIIADCHVHLYAFYDLAAAFGSALRNLASAAAGRAHVKVLCLTERQDCHAFQDIKNGTLALPAGFEVATTAEENALRLRDERGRSFFLLAGRQIVTAEGIEILGLGQDSFFQDGGESGKTLAEITRQGGLAVFGWAPGKWMFRRGKIIRRLIEDAPKQSLLLCDSLMRPAGFPEPSLLALGRRRGLKIIAGSDAYPLAGEEKYIGRYAAAAEFEFDENKPLSSMRAILCDPAVTLRIVGKRLSPGKALQRWLSLRNPRLFREQP